MTKTQIKTEIQQNLAQETADYLQECHSLAEDGYRPATCFHGTNLWTDYDNICGPCEEEQYDPRYHSTKSDEFNQEVEIRLARRIREEQVKSLITLVKTQATQIRTEQDLKIFHTTVDLVKSRLSEI